MDGRLTSLDDSYHTKREVLRYVMMITDQSEYFKALSENKNKELLSMHKMEMAVICLLHLELRVGENILTSICQRIVNRVSNTNVKVSP